MSRLASDVCLSLSSSSSLTFVVRIGWNVPLIYVFKENCIDLCLVCM